LNLPHLLCHHQSEERLNDKKSLRFNHLASKWFPSDLHYNIRPKQELESTKVDESSNSLRAQNSQ